MLIQLWETDPLMVGMASALGVPLILCLMFFWSRYVEYLTFRRMLRNGTAQVLRRILSRYKGRTFSIMTEESLKGLRSQRYVFEKAVTAEIPSLAPYLIKLMNVCPHPRCTLKTYIFPQI